MSWQGKPDPVETTLERAFNEAGIEYRRADANPRHLDFYLPAFDLYVEVKRYHTDRTAKQMERVPDIVVIQGMKAAVAFARMIGGYTEKKYRKWQPRYGDILEWNEQR